MSKNLKISIKKTSIYNNINIIFNKSSEILNRPKMKSKNT